MLLLSSRSLEDLCPSPRLNFVLALAPTIWSYCFLAANAGKSSGVAAIEFCCCHAATTLEERQMYAPSLGMTVLARCKLWLSLLAVVPCLIDVPHLQLDVPWLLCQIQQLHFFGEVSQLQIHFLQLQSEVFVLSSVVLSLPAMCFHCMARCCSFRSSYRHPQCQIESKMATNISCQS